MFPRVALVIFALLGGIIISIFVRGAFVAQQIHCVITCNRGVAEPYQQPAGGMRQLAETGQDEKLRTLIIRAQERSSDVSRVCTDKKEDLYAEQVRAH